MRTWMTFALLFLAPASVAMAQRPLTEAEQLEGARKYETAVNNRDRAAIERAFDVDAMLDRATRGYDSADPLVQAFRQGFKSRFQFGAAIAT